MKEFIQDAIRTESKLERLLVDPEKLATVLNLCVLSSNLLDGMKKNIFYGKEINEDSVDEDLDQIIKMAINMKMLQRLYSNVEEFERIDPRVFHGIVGMHTESAELIQALGDAMFDDKTIDTVNVGEELGDSDWYKAIVLDSLGLDEDAIRAKVIAKLKKRYPGKFSAEAAINRDVAAERKLLEE